VWRWLQTGEAGIASISPETMREVERRSCASSRCQGPCSDLPVLYIVSPRVPALSAGGLRVRQALSLAINRQQIIDHVSMARQAGLCPGNLSL